MSSKMLAVGFQTWIVLTIGTFGFTQDSEVSSPIPTIEEVFAEPRDSLSTAALPADFNNVLSCDSCAAEDCVLRNEKGLSPHTWLCSDELFLSCLKGQHLSEDWTYSVGGALQYRYINESNRLRPPLTAGRSSYQQWRFSPYVEVSRGDRITFYSQMIDASTFGNELPLVPIDENRWDLLQAYVDLKALELEQGDLRYRYGRQWLIYGAQHLLSNLGWGNTYRNFEGHRAYYAGKSWDVDVLAVQAVDGAARGSVYNINSFDGPNQDQWLGGVYATYKDFGSGALDVYWLWSDVDNAGVNVINGNRHTIGARWAGKKPVPGTSSSESMTWEWDLEGAYQFGTEDYLAGPSQDVQAGFVSTIGKLTLEEVAWKPTLVGLFWWGSGDDDPTDGTSNTVSTLYPLGHAYWGMIDNHNGSNLLDYSAQIIVKPTNKLSFLTAWHWFDKAAAQDGIYNVGGVPFGGVNPSPKHLGNELDLVSTYQVNKNLKLQLGYFWYWYGAAVNNNPNATVANRDDAEQIYFLTDWQF